MLNLKIFLVKVLNAILCAEIDTDSNREKILGFNEVATAELKFKIRNKTISDLQTELQNPQSEYYVKIDKSLAFLTKEGYQNEPAVQRHTGFSIVELQKIYQNMLGQKLTAADYFDKINQ